MSSRKVFPLLLSEEEKKYFSDFAISRKYSTAKLFRVFSRALIFLLNKDVQTPEEAITQAELYDNTNSFYKS